MWSALRRRCLQSARSKPVHRINRDHDHEAAFLRASGEEIVGRRVASEDMYRIACSAERETDLADKDRERNVWTCAGYPDARLLSVFFTNARTTTTLRPTAVTQGASDSIAG